MKKLAIGAAIFLVIFIMMFVVVIMGVFKSSGGSGSVRGGGYMSGVMSPEDYEKLKDLITGDTLGDRMMSLSGKITYQSTDGTNCMRTVSLCIDKNDPRYGWLGNGDTVNVPNAIAKAQERGYYQEFRGFGDLEEGDILVFDGDNHVGVVGSNGTLIQNGASHNTVYKADIGYNGTPTGVIKKHKLTT